VQKVRSSGYGEGRGVKKHPHPSRREGGSSSDGKKGRKRGKDRGKDDDDLVTFRQKLKRNITGSASKYWDLNGRRKRVGGVLFNLSPTGLGDPTRGGEQVRQNKRLSESTNKRVLKEIGRG